MAKPIPRREGRAGPGAQRYGRSACTTGPGLLRLDQNSVNAGKITAPHVRVQLIADQHRLVCRGAEALKTRLQGKRGGLHGVANGLKSQLACRAHDLVAMPVVRNHAQLKSLGASGVEPSGNRSGNLLGVARHQSVIAIEQNGAFAVGHRVSSRCDRPRQRIVWG